VRRGRLGTVCTRDAHQAASIGRSTSPLGDTKKDITWLWRQWQFWVS
jgi:hypothetical protein